MKTVEEVIAFLEDERDRLDELGTYEKDVEYLEILIKKIKGEENE